MPIAWRTTAARAHTTSPGPQATSSTVSSGPAPAKSTSSRSASSSRTPGAVENGTACLVNCSTMRSRCAGMAQSNFRCVIGTWPGWLATRASQVRMCG